MLCIAPSEKNADNAALEKHLWDAADQSRANSELKSQEYSAPVLGLIFLRFAEVRFTAQRAALEKAGTSSQRGSRVDEPAAYAKCCSEEFAGQFGSLAIGTSTSHQPVKPENLLAMPSTM